MKHNIAEHILTYCISFLGSLWGILNHVTKYNFVHQLLTILLLQSKRSRHSRDLQHLSHRLPGDATLAYSSKSHRDVLAVGTCFGCARGEG